jgi:Tfp pilus assembly protein PilV
MKRTCRRKGERAFTFVEVMASVALLMVGFLGAYATMTSCGALRETSAETNIAVFKLQTAMEYLLVVSFNDINKLPPFTPSVVSTTRVVWVSR